MRDCCIWPFSSRTPLWLRSLPVPHPVIIIFIIIIHYSFFYYSLFCSVAGLWHSPLFVALRCSQFSAAVFTSGYFAKDTSSLSICSIFLPQYALPCILTSIMLRSRTSFLSISPNHPCFHCRIVVSFTD